MRMAIDFVLGAIILALGVWWMINAGHTVNGILSALVIALGGGLITVAVANGLNKYSRTDVLPGE